MSDIRRFHNGWERTASVQLRVGENQAIDQYDKHGRITAGARADLNQRARADLTASGKVSETGLDVADGCVTGVGDLVVTRENNRLLTAGRGWVKNGDLWTVTATNTDGATTLRRISGGGEVVLPPAYVKSHVKLAYASTAHRAQGRTVDRPTRWSHRPQPGRPVCGCDPRT